MTPFGGVASRLVVVALLALGLVGMHHLVIAACHHVPSLTHSASTPVAMHASEASSHATGHGLPAIATEGISQGSSDGAPMGLVDVAATCLAVILMLVILLAPRLMSRLRRLLAPDRFPLSAHAVARLVAPPDLHLLSISRT